MFFVHADGEPPVIGVSDSFNVASDADALS